MFDIIIIILMPWNDRDRQCRVETLNKYLNIKVKYSRSKRFVIIINPKLGKIKYCGLRLNKKKKL